MRVWRICRKAYAADSLSGKGGLFASGRWHRRGHPVVYTSQSLALAALEVLVHVDRDLAPADLVQQEVDLPEDLEIEVLPRDTLPRNWQVFDENPLLKDMGTDWLESKRSPVLQVPSIVIPEESNYLINPLHPATAQVIIASCKDFRFDARLAR